jgi:hypothetical protein
MRIPPTGYLTLALLCGELVCVIIWALTHLVVGIAAGIGSVIAAMRWED